MVQHLQKVERLYGSSKQKLSKEELRRKNLYALKLFGQKTSCFVERLGYLDMYNKDGHQASLKQDLFQLEMEVLSKGGWETIFNTSEFKKATLEHFLERPFASKEVFQKMSLRSNSYALASVQNPGLSQWCHSYLSYLPFSPWYCSHFREPTLHWGRCIPSEGLSQHPNPDLSTSCTSILWRRV